MKNKDLGTEKKNKKKIKVLKSSKRKTASFYSILKVAFVISRVSPVSSSGSYT